MAELKNTGYQSEIDGIEVDFELQYRDRETDMKERFLCSDQLDRYHGIAVMEMCFP